MATAKTPATTQMVAAVVRPCMAPRAWMIEPAPIKPIPVTTCEAMRDGSTRVMDSGPSVAIVMISLTSM